MEHDGFGAVVVHDGFDDWFEDVFVGPVVNAIAEGEIDGVVFALADTDIAELTGTREIFAVFVKRHGHDSVCGVESFFNAVTVVDVDVDVQDALLVPE